MSDLAEFLLARIAEDEARAEEAAGKHVDFRSDWQNIAVVQHVSRWTSARVLAECEAKRFVIDALRGYEPCDEWGTEPDIGKRANNAAGALRRMALPYADHPDWREEWRL